MTKHDRSLEFGHFAIPTAEAHPQLLRQVPLRGAVHPTYRRARHRRDRKGAERSGR
jgi:hypothetical protein